MEVRGIDQVVHEGTVGLQGNGKLIAVDGKRDEL